MIVKITNTLNQPLCLFYRLKNGEGKSSLIEVALPPRALLHEIPFATVEHFKAFESQNLDSIESQTIILGNVKESKAEQASQDNAKTNKEKIKQKKDAVVHAIEGAAGSAGVDMRFNVQEDARERERRGV